MPSFYDEVVEEVYVPESFNCEIHPVTDARGFRSQLFSVSNLARRTVGITIGALKVYSEGNVFDKESLEDLIEMLEAVKESLEE